MMIKSKLKNINRWKLNLF